MISKEQPICKANFLFEETSYKFYLLILSGLIKDNFYYRNELFHGCYDAIIYHMKAIDVLFKVKEGKKDLAAMQKARLDALDYIDKSEYAKYTAEKGIRKWIDKVIKSLEADSSFEKVMGEIVDCMANSEESSKSVQGWSWRTDAGGDNNGKHPETNE